MDIEQLEKLTERMVTATAALQELLSFMRYLRAELGVEAAKAEQDEEAYGRIYGAGVPMEER